MQHQAHDVTSAWDTFDGMWLDLRSQKAGIDRISEINNGTWLPWKLEHDPGMLKKYHLSKNPTENHWYEIFRHMKNSQKFLLNLYRIFLLPEKYSISK